MKAEDYSKQLSRELTEGNAKRSLQIFNDYKTVRRLVKRLHANGILGTESAAIILTQCETMRDKVLSHQHTYEAWSSDQYREKAMRQRKAEEAYLSKGWDEVEEDAIHDINLV